MFGPGRRRKLVRCARAGAGLAAADRRSGLGLRSVRQRLVGLCGGWVSLGFGVSLGMDALPVRQLVVFRRVWLGMVARHWLRRLRLGILGRCAGEYWVGAGGISSAVAEARTSPSAGAGSRGGERGGCEWVRGRVAAHQWDYGDAARTGGQRIRTARRQRNRGFAATRLSRRCCHSCGGAWASQHAAAGGAYGFGMAGAGGSACCGCSGCTDEPFLHGADSSGAFWVTLDHSSGGAQRACSCADAAAPNLYSCSGAAECSSTATSSSAGSGCCSCSGASQVAQNPADSVILRAASLIRRAALNPRISSAMVPMRGRSRLAIPGRATLLALVLGFQRAKLSGLLRWSSWRRGGC